MRVLLIDNYDSFTYNLYHAMWRVSGCCPVVLRNDDRRGLAELDRSTIDGIVISPGPGSPDRERDFGISGWALAQHHLPVLGICLGHQGMCLTEGATVARAPEPVPGSPSAVHHNGDPLFAGIPTPFAAVRYHSLLVYDLPDSMTAIASTADGLLMAARHRHRPHWGVQFHPESIATEHGEALLANFRDLAGVGPRRPAARAVAPPAAPAPAYTLKVHELEKVPDAEAAFAALFGDDPAAYWLDSSRVIPGLSRFSVLGGSRGPLAEVASYRVGTDVVVSRGDGAPVGRYRESIFSYIDRTLSERRMPDAGLPFDFNLGYVGYLGYELKADCGAARAHRSAEPDSVLIFSDRALVIDHQDGRAWLLALATAEHPADRWLRTSAAALADLAPLAPPPTPIDGEPPPPVVARHTGEAYGRLIAECHEAIASGESYEVCLTNMLSVPVDIDPWLAYRVLRRVNPAPYAAYLKLHGFTVLSSSPERFLSIGADGVIESKPIKGTRPRGRTPDQDVQLRGELLGSEKERAENLMIVDLVRNDIGRVARPGSVNVPALFHVETYQTVHQLVSTIRGQLGQGSTTVDCVRAAFPGGSMTGAPKLRTMEIIDRLEAGPRGVYSGALGYLSLNGGVDLSIVIRTMVATPHEVRIGAGGAITALSDPAAEIEETWVKARALLRTLTTARSAAALTGSVR